jgi:hypothetical protein
MHTCLLRATRSSSGLLTSRSSSVKKGKSRIAEEDVIVQSTAALAHAMKDGMETLVQGISGALKAPPDVETATRLDRVEKMQLEMKQAQEVAEEAAKSRHEALVALFAREKTDSR